MWSCRLCNFFKNLFVLKIYIIKCDHSVFRQKSMFFEGFRRNGWHHRFRRVETIRMVKFSAQTDATSPCFQQFSNFLVRCIFLFWGRKRSKVKDSEQTDIRFEFSSSRSIGMQVFSPNGRNQPMFSTVFHFFGVTLLFFAVFLFLVSG